MPEGKVLIPFKNMKMLSFMAKLSMLHARQFDWSL